MPRIIDATANPQTAILAALNVIRDGGCVVLPTDTVYGIAANPFNPDAVQHLLDTKRRGKDMPPPILIADARTMFALAAEISQPLEAVTERFWPGGLTVIVKTHPALAAFAPKSATIALRVPAHRFTCDLLRITGPLAVSSANISGNPPATTNAAAVAQFGEQVPLYLDFDATPGSEPSTILDMTGATPKILRSGVVSAKELGEVIEIQT
ncbi:MAG: L-threonylcarbamoyladenylate synthase [Propionibacteriaceae bacterium]|nr:L-threonylcarbamoyladenylate synthase [Propionibacteriaceae bacterium]